MTFQLPESLNCYNSGSPNISTRFLHLPNKIFVVNFFNAPVEFNFNTHVSFFWGGGDVAPFRIRTSETSVYVYQPTRLNISGVFSDTFVRNSERDFNSTLSIYLTFLPSLWRAFGSKHVVELILNKLIVVIDTVYRDCYFFLVQYDNKYLS